MISVDKVLRLAEEEFRFDPRKVCAAFVSVAFPQHAFNRIRTVLLRALGVQIAATSCFAGAVKITGTGSIAQRLSIGPGCYLTGPLHIDLLADVRVGARVYMGYDVALITADHDIGPSSQRCGPRLQGSIEIGDGAWIGSRAVILPGVRVGPGAVVAAGSVVASDVASDTLVAGVPAKMVRALCDDASDEAIAPSNRRGRLTASEPPEHWLS